MREIERNGEKPPKRPHPRKHAKTLKKRGKRRVIGIKGRKKGGNRKKT